MDIDSGSTGGNNVDRMRQIDKISTGGDHIIGVRTGNDL